MDFIFAEIVFRYAHFFSSMLWLGAMFFMFIVVFPVNRDGYFTKLFPRVNRFVLILSTISLASGILLAFFNPKFSFQRLFETTWGNLIIIGGAFGLFVYINILIRNRPRKNMKFNEPPGILKRSHESYIEVKSLNNDEYKKKSGSFRSLKIRNKTVLPWMLLIILIAAAFLMAFASHGYI